MLAPLIEPYKSSELMLLALCIWREARGESIEAKRGVASVIRNRCALAPAQGFKSTASANILKPWAFSSFMQGDPNAVKYPAEADPSWHDSLAAAGIDGKSPDLSCGAVFYYSKPLTCAPHAWGQVYHSATIGGLEFYRLTA
jgi:spore germination cell wall hydrolase CwlJ-like protein